MLKIKEDESKLRKLGFVKQYKTTYNMGERNELLTSFNDLTDWNFRKVVHDRYVYKDELYIDYFKYKKEHLKDIDLKPDWYRNNGQLFKMFGTSNFVRDNMLFDLIQAGLVEKVADYEKIFQRGDK